MIRKQFVFLGILGLLIAAWAALLWWPRPQPTAQPRPRPPSPAVASRPTVPPVPAPPSQAAPRGGPTPGVGAGHAGPQQPAQAPAEPGLMARVNGEPVYAEDVTSGLNRDMFGLMMGEASRSRLDRLISIMTTRQYLKAQNIAVADEQVEQEVGNLRRNPPAAGCACCRYGSLEEFLSANLMTVKDLRDSIRNDLGLNQHVAALWNAEYPPGEKRDGLLAKERQRIEQSLMKIAHIFFNTVQQSDYPTDPEGVRERAKAKAAAAWQRLQKGEDFAKLAGECSEDAFSRPKGGSLGGVPRGAFGKDVEAAVQQLKPGAYSRPVESPWGVHVIRREAMGDADILDALQAEYRDKKLQELCASIQERAKVERFDRGPGKD